MNFTELLLICGGILSIFMGIFHTQFPRIFKWKQSFKKEAVANFKILYTIHIALMIFLFGSGLLSIVFASKLAEKEILSVCILIYISILWIWRTIWQIYYFKIPKNIDNKPIMHYLLIVYFLLLSVLYTLSIFF